MYVPAGVGVAVTVAAPEQIDGLFTVTVGFGFNITVPLAEVLEHPVAVLVMITLYDPETVAEKDATLPGLVAPVGTVHAYEYVPAGEGVAVTVALDAQTVGLFTVTVGKGLTVTVPLADVLEHPVVALVMITLYDPETDVVKVATFPGLVAPVGTVHE